ncbi:hypothetical protein, conserved [Plasmodium gonderi]|uniref:Uncharacterized protein n=1 Tax=Plasmodium gonderi TaxID=77519 RepID=A0A1Y1J9F6_PLAGO|nr:hypothetical protein, conserved [Plasmodium gonderi]GAW78900.1 hypothetical protein, conserved [Plasmodium gonderi]
MYFYPFQFTLLVAVVINFFSHALRNYKKFRVKPYIQVWRKSKNRRYFIQRRNKKREYFSAKRKRKFKGAFELYNEHMNDLGDIHENNGNNNDESNNDESNNDDKDDNDEEDEISYEEIEEYLKKNKIEDNCENSDGKKEIINLINYIPTLKNQDDFFSKFGYFSSENKSMEYYFNEMKNLKEKKQKKNHNILNFILSYYLKKKNTNDTNSSLKNYKNIHSYYYYLNDVINNRISSFPVSSAEPAKKDNIFSRKTLCNFISLYLKNVNIIKYVSFFCVSGIITLSLKVLIRNIKLEDIFLLRNHFNLIYSFKNMHVCKIGIFSLLLNLLFIKSYNQYFCVTEDLFGILFTNYFFYEGISNLNKKKMEEFMDKYNYTLDDVLNSLNDIFSHYIYNQIYTVEKMDQDDIVFTLNSFVSLYHKLFRNNNENIKNIITHVINKYNTYYVDKDEKKNEILSRIFYIFYLINIMFKYKIDSVEKLNLHRENNLQIPFFEKSNKISSYSLLCHIAQLMGVKEKFINDKILERMKSNYEFHIRSILNKKQYSNNIIDDVKKMSFITLDNSILEQVHFDIFVNMIKSIIEDDNYDPVYFIPSHKENKIKLALSRNHHSKKDKNDKFVNVVDVADEGPASNEQSVEYNNSDIGKEELCRNSEKDTDYYISDDYRNDDEIDEDATEMDEHSDNDNVYEEENDSIVEDSDDNMYKYLENIVEYIVNDDSSKSEGSSENKKDNIAEREERENKEKELFLKKWNDINFLRKYLHIDKNYTDKYLEKYLYDYMYKEYKILINNLVFKKLKNKNDNLFFLKRGISISNRATENIIKNIILNFVIKTKENIAIFYKLENMHKCLRLITNLINVYKKIKKKKKFLKIVSDEFFNLDDLFSCNYYKPLELTYKENSILREGDNSSSNQKDKQISDRRAGEPDGLHDEVVKDHIGKTVNEEQLNKVIDNDVDIDQFEGRHMDGKPFEEDFSSQGQSDEEEFLRRIINKDELRGEENEKDIILSEIASKRLYEEFVIKHMKNKSERKIFKIIFNLNYDQVDREVEDNIIGRFLEKICTKCLNNLTEIDDNLKIIGKENLFDYKNVNFKGFIEKEKLKRGYKYEKNEPQEGAMNANITIRKEDIFEHIDDESFEELCKKMYIKKVKEVKKNLYNKRKELYFYEIILNIKNAQEIHNIFLIDEYEKMINDIIKTNILNKNYKNIKNLYLKKIINFLNITDDRASDVEIHCIFNQTNEIFSAIKENFYIYRNDSDFINNINEILTIYKNFDLIWEKGPYYYYVKFALIESNYNFIYRMIERYVLYVIDLINNENRTLYKENIFKLVAIFHVNHTVIDEIATRIYKKYIENEDLHGINNMDSFFSFLFNMSKERQSEMVLDFLKKKVDTHLTSSESFQEKFHKMYNLFTYINNNMNLKMNIFDLSSASTDGVYSFLKTCIDEYLHVKKAEVFISEHRDYINQLNNFLSKIKTLIKGDQENTHLNHILNLLKKETIRKAIDLLDKFKYDICVEEIYNLIKLQMIDSNINFSDIDIEKRKKLINIFSYQNISDEKKFLYLDILNKSLL